MKLRGLFISLLVLCGACATQTWAAPDPADLGAGAHFIRGTFEQGRQPDGNTVVLEGKGGLIVFDTGRHASHSQKIIDYADTKGEPVVAIFNSHWHLDHISGNPRLLDLWPKAAVYSSDRALTEALGSFLARGAEANRKTIAEGKAPAGQMEDARTDLATVESGARLHPTASIEASTTLTIAGRRIEAHAAKGASAGDVWLYDPEAHLVVAGDLIRTMPAPFLDTGCAAAWSAALQEILAEPFAQAVPGHGRVMNRPDVALYRDAFNALIICGRSTTDTKTCADNWAASVAPLQDGAEADGAAARTYADYYAGLVRRGPKRADCAG